MTDRYKMPVKKKKYNFNDRGFDNLVVKDEDGLLVIRTDAMSEEDAMRWKDVYCEKFNVCFNVIKSYDVVRLGLHTRYMCIFGDRRHKGVKKTCTGCDVTMNIKIRCVTKNTVKKDKTMRTHPCFITIKGNHNHSTQSATAMRQLRVLPDTKEEYFTYFDSGMTPAQAIKFHQEKMDLNLGDLANNAINPVCRSIYYFHDIWQKQKITEAAPLPDITDLYEGIGMAFKQFGDSETPKAIAVMLKRLKSLKSSSHFNSFLYSFGGSSVRMGGAGRGKIPCQPTSVARRQVGLPRGAAPIGKSRKRKNNLVVKSAKRQKNLALNILQNQPNTINTTENKPIAINATENKPNAINATENLPNYIKATENQPNAINATENLPNAINATEDQPNAINATENQPNAINATENLPNDIKATENQPNAINATKNQPNAIKATENQPNTIKATENRPNVIKATENRPNVIKATENQPNAIKATENQLTAIKATENQPTTIKATENQPNAINATENQPNANNATENQPNAIKATENHPNAINATENHPNAINATENHPNVA